MNEQELVSWWLAKLDSEDHSDPYLEESAPPERSDAWDSILGEQN